MIAISFVVRLWAGLRFLSFCLIAGSALPALTILSAAAAAASTDLSEAAICEEAGAFASARVGVPEDVLRALSRTETGRNLEGHFVPWPWTVNMEGTGKWFDTPDEALAFALAEHQRGARSFDIGCFQVNFKYHGQAFGSIRDMFDPYQNALYAARFLASLYLELGDWTKAAGAYHSRTPDLASRYSSRFADIYDGLDGLPLPEAAPLRLAEVEAGPPPPPEFAPLIPETNVSGSLFLISGSGGAGGLLTKASGSLIFN